MNTTNVLFWLSNTLDLCWSLLIVWATFEVSPSGFLAWLLFGVLALYPLQCITQRFTIKRLRGQ